mmetsp:Transcript_19419/g.46371  ORF Transcript_19419/g.46371 Transcript_19419/m.46371 type:complete len:121 (-) Transcript_19419:115-477(-)
MASSSSSAFRALGRVSVYACTDQGSEQRLISSARHYVQNTSGGVVSEFQTERGEKFASAQEYIDEAMKERAPRRPVTATILCTKCGQELFSTYSELFTHQAECRGPQLLDDDSSSQEEVS